MSCHIQGQDRSQVTLFPEALDDFVTENNPIKVIDAFVDQLDLHSLGFLRTKAKSTGRPGYHPATLLKLYIYGYLNRIQSSRRLEREAHRNVELMWLIERLTPDFKTIADFRKDNGKGIKNACRTFIELCRSMNMFSEAVVAIDGSKFKAVNSKQNNYTPQKVRAHIERFEKHIEQYLAQLDQADAADFHREDEVTVAQKISWMKQRISELRIIEDQVNRHPEKQVSTTDPDSRLLKTKGMTRQVCYNVQSAVDTKYHLIVAHEVTNTNDRGQLTHVARLAQSALANDEITVIADKGYYSRQDIKEAQDTGVTALVPKGDTSGSEKNGFFNKSLFRYEQERDLYTCPSGQELQYRFESLEKGQALKVYFNGAACRDCSIRAKCTRSKKEPRKMRRWVHEDEMEDMERRLQAAPDTMLIRKSTVEHPFGTIKAWMGATHFLTRRFKNVSTEMGLHVLAYNLKRMLSITGPENLLRALKE